MWSLEGDVNLEMTTATLQQDAKLHLVVCMVQLTSKVGDCHRETHLEHGEQHEGASQAMGG